MGVRNQGLTMSTFRTTYFLRCFALGLAATAMLATACSSTATSGTGDAPTSFDQAAAQNEAAQSGAAQTDAAQRDSAQTDEVTGESTGSDDISAEEVELFLEAFEDSFVARDVAAGDELFDVYEITTTVPEGGGVIDHSATLPYGLCGISWVVFDLLTWADAIAMLGIDPATYTGQAPVATYDNFYSNDDDNGARLLKDSLRCSSGDGDGTTFGDGTTAMRVQMQPFSDPGFINPDFFADQLGDDLQFLTTQTGQPMIIKLSTDSDSGNTDRVEVLLRWEWSNSRDRGAQLTIDLANLTNGLNEEEIQGAINIAELISAEASFTPPAFEPPLPTWFSCEGRNFVHSDVAEVAEIAGIPGPVELIRWVDNDWDSTQCAISTPGRDGLADGAFGVAAEVFPAGSENYDRFLEGLDSELAAVEGSTTIAGRPMVTYSSDFVSVVLLDDGVDRVAIEVFPQTGADADTALAKAIEIARVITR